MKSKFLWVLCMSLVLLLAACGTSQSNGKNEKEQITISAAASLTDVTKELETAFHKKHQDVNLEFNYGGSGALRQQIEKGAPADVLMSANTKDVDALKKQGKVTDIYDYAHNKLVLIKSKDSELTGLDSLKDSDKLAIGEVESVPAGKYAKKYLERQHLWDTVQSHIVYAKDVREVLNYVDKGNAQLGFVYETDLFVGDQPQQGVEKVFEAELDKPITYRMGLVTDNKAAKEWLEFMQSDEAKQILKKYHFEV
ncbi:MULTISPECIES: molybdate ABC transporter substrate-binding protein [unclassified Staphylococcus]|uniref:molybdate ABC transporter substrate-binding protein n=1 Tax=unclassified Staphylococcus TaxID=91994 RepID=UPI0021D16465|nr:MULTISPECIES: molybdate ABC transporter substrate-binding protein [unclassified Staphylococcus]UXR79401.1 molybdate ABC transporter substrate-binding protein [Staphylococcus sp. IVB6227]UXR82175.1 molybdate ABC transporter substrate-binding protein [Staphylococcus sp. IVB6214]